MGMFWAGTAFGGNFLATGHDLDNHCRRTTEQCNFLKASVNFVRAGAPGPSKPVLILDRGLLHMPKAIDAAFGSGAVPMVVIDPRSAEFVTAPINTNLYSAVALASDKTCVGCDLNEADSTPDSDAINARKGDLKAFFNAGGGLLYAAGANHGDGNPANGTDAYYASVPLGVVGAPVSPPFRLTADGSAIGLQDSANDDPPGATNNDINCCPTHNSFTQPPSGSVLKVAERDSTGIPETLIARGIIGSGGFEPPPPPSAEMPPRPSVLNPNNTVTPAQAFVLPSNRRCVSRRNFRIRIVRPIGVKYIAARVSVAGRQVPVVVAGGRYRTLRGTVLDHNRLTARVDLRGFPKGTFAVTIKAVTTTLRTVTGVRKYRTCGATKTVGRPRV